MAYLPFVQEPFPYAMMNLPTREQAGVLIVSVSGRIDHITSEEFTKSLDPLLDQCTQGHPSILLDFSGVDYISSAGLRVLMMASRRAKAQKGGAAEFGKNRTLRPGERA